MANKYTDTIADAMLDGVAPESKEAPASGASTYKIRTDEEIKQLALDTHAGRIFWGTQVAPQDKGLLGSIFLVLLFMGEAQMEHLMKLDAIPYEYIDKAGPRSINGYPCFFSMNYLDHDDYSRVVAKVQEIEAALAKV